MVTVVNQISSIGQYALNALLPDEPQTLGGTLPKSLKSVAVICPYFIGDTILATTLIQNLQTVYKKIVLIAAPSQCNLLETLPDLAGVLPTPKTQDEKIALLNALRCDAVFILRYSLPWAFAAKEANIPYRVGFDLERFGLHKLQHWMTLLTHATPSGTIDSQEHQTTFYQKMLLQLGLNWDTSISPAVSLSETDYAAMQGLLEQFHSPRFILHASAGSPGKRWPMHYWVELLEKLSSHYHPNWLAIGTAADRQKYERMADQSGIPIGNLCGETSLRESAVLCRQSDLIITLDTAIAHLAAAVEAPRIVILYGPTNPYQWRPIVSGRTKLEQVFLDLPCRPCVTRMCYHRSCSQYLKPERVMAHIRKIMEI